MAKPKKNQAGAVAIPTGGLEVNPEQQRGRDPLPNTESDAPEAEEAAQPTDAEIEAKFDALPEADKNALYQKALKDIAAKVGMAPDRLEALGQMEAPKKKQMMVVEMGPRVVSINGKEFSGTVVVSEDVAEVLMETLGKVRMRYLREMIRHEWVMEIVAGGAFRQSLKNEAQAGA